MSLLTLIFHNTFVGLHSSVLYAHIMILKVYLEKVSIKFNANVILELCNNKKKMITD